MQHIKAGSSRIVALLSLLAAAACGGPAPSTTSAPAVDPNIKVFEGARVIVGDGSAPIENATIVVQDDRILAVGPAASVTSPANGTRINVAGKTIMPAIADTHTHLGQTREALTADLRRRAYYGVGAALSLGQDTGQAAFEMRLQPVPGAARMRTAGRGITMPEKGRSEAPYWITTEAEGLKAVAELTAQQVDIVKIWVDDRNGQYKKLPPTLYKPIIEEAHRRGHLVTAHIFALADAKALLRAGVDAFAHSIRDKDVDDEVMTLFKERPNVVLVPNLPDRGVATDMGWLKAGLPADEWQKLQDAATDKPDAQKTFGIQARNLAKLAAAGVKIALGTDGNVPWSPHVEMADMVAAGMTPVQVIVASTSTAAWLMGLHDAGTIEVGKHADLLVLDANPLDDITNTRRISAVYMRGAAVDRATSPMMGSTN